MNRLSEDEFRQKKKLPLTVVLDDVRSMHNIGAVFRTADAFLIESVYLCGISATPPHQEIHKTALGAEFTVSWKYFRDTVEAVRELRGAGHAIFAIEQCENSHKLDQLMEEWRSEAQGDRRLAIVLGNEVKGVKQEVVDLCDGCIEIPQYGTKHSLNVSVAAGIVMWELSTLYLHSQLQRQV